MKTNKNSTLDFLRHKTVLITGGTGSFGKNFAKYILRKSDLKKLIIFSRDELKQAQMRLECEDERLRFFVGDVRDLQRLERAFSGVDIVIHAAALKQVPIIEYNPFEAVKTNILGSQNVIDAAIDKGVEKVVLVSTDKAAHPVNLYGSTKLCAEKLFINGNAYSAGKTALSCIRYGNVVGSRGSVVDVLLRTKGKTTVTITHEEMTRFWINLEQSFALVLFALETMVGGEIFIPKIPSMKIVDLFKTLAPQAKQKITGIRPGEKIHEILVTKEEARHGIELDEYFVILPEHDEIFDVETRFAKILSVGRKLPANFCYSSDSNPEWLTKDKLSKVVKKIDIT